MTILEMFPLVVLAAAGPFQGRPGAGLRPVDAVSTRQTESSDDHGQARAGAPVLPGVEGAARVFRRASEPVERPNIVLFLVDDLGWKDTGITGSDFYRTPHIDTMARQGMIFTAAYANGPNCAPSRACLMSGQYPPRHGIYTVNSPARGKASRRRLIPIPNQTTLDPSVVTVAESLRSAGYTCAAVGKWHLGDDPQRGPRAQGFAVNIAGGHWGHPPHGYFAPFGLPAIEEAPEAEYLTDRLTSAAVSFIESNAERPFFLYLAHYAVHTPLQARAEAVARAKARRATAEHHNATYAAMIESVDDSLGRILETLDRLELARRTLVVFFSDNGGVRRITSMAPLRGGKGMLYEGGIREPMIVRWPGVVEAGTRCDVPVIGIDFYPTFLEVASAAAPQGQILDGSSLVPLLKGERPAADRALFWHFPAYLEGQAPGARDRFFRTRPCGAVRLGRWKLIEYFEDGALELYDLSADIGESRNLAAESREKTTELRALMEAWRRELAAPVPRRPNPKFVDEG